MPLPFLACGLPRLVAGFMVRHQSLVIVVAVAVAALVYGSSHTHAQTHTRLFVLLATFSQVVRRQRLAKCQL